MVTGRSVLAIILNWRQAEMTLECVRSLTRMAEPQPAILVIENGSDDGSGLVLQNALLPGEVLEMPQNLGFAGGANVGLQRAIDDGFDYALLVNNDAFPATDMLTRLLTETADDVALLSPKILYEAEPERIWFAGGLQDPRLLELRERGKGELDGPKWQRSQDVDYLLGTCLLVNLAAIKDVGLLDDRYFMYYEDLDWSIRCRAAGYRLRLVADARVYHRVSASSGGAESPDKRYLLARSSVLFFRRHAALGQPMAIVLFRAGASMKMITSLLLRGQFRALLAYVRGLWDGWQLSRGELPHHGPP